MATSKESTGKSPAAVIAKGAGRSKRHGKGKTPRTPRTYKPKDLSLEAWQIRLRREFGREQKFLLENLGQEPFFSEFRVTNPGTGGIYRLGIRGARPGDNYCSCPDFSVNTLGTCKHIEFTLARLMKRRGAKAAFREGFQPPFSEVYLRYGAQREVAFRSGANAPERVRSLAARFFDERGILKPSAFETIEVFLKEASKGGFEIRFYEDAVQFVAQVRDDAARRRRIQRAFPGGAGSPAFEGLLKTPLYPYQREGALFAALAGRSLIADDMGLGKTIEALAAVEILAGHAGAGRVLVICPTSLKHQWHEEIERFTGRSVSPVQGTLAARAACYETDSFYKITSYDVIYRDAEAIARWAPDVIILDEAQRIKNWRTRTAQSIKKLSSPYAVVLTGTPLENRLEELFSVISFIDERHLGPAFRFLHKHRQVDEKGKVLGYKNMTELRENLRPVLLRRTRDSVMQELPPRTTEIVRIVPTEEQREMNATNMRLVSQIVSKKFLTEMDLLRLQKHLLLSRMSADSTYLVDKQPPGFSTKLEELKHLLTNLAAENDRKIILFSEWTTMLDLIEPILTDLSLAFVRLDGSVPQKKRQHLVHEFQTNPQCRVFITTNAGSTGLNLQAANTVINVDLPWNPAVLEQRISRAHRMGQKRPVQVYILVTEQTIEEKMLATLATKKHLALAALDPNSKLDHVDFSSGLSELKQRLEVLIGAKPEEAVDESQKARVTAESETARAAQAERMAVAGGQFLTAAFGLIGEIIPQRGQPEVIAQWTEGLRKNLAESMVRDEKGRLSFAFTLPDESALTAMAAAMARLIPPPVAVGTFNNP